MQNTMTASVVAYKTDKTELTRVLQCMLTQRYALTIYLVDNSPTDELQSVVGDCIDIVYIHNPTNPGFGASHNIAIQEAIQIGSLFHFIVNPDIYFKGDVIAIMVQKMQLDASIGMLMPRILNPDGSVQFLPKLLPAPWHIIWRKLKWPRKAFQHFMNQYELRMVSEFNTMNVPILSGCFTLLNLDAIRDIGLYDDTFFMYFEDWDLSRRVHQKYQTLYFPDVSVFHEYHSGANHNMKLFIIFLRSAYHYFTKWGWFYDKDRLEINRKVLEQIG
jgi:GT2 family glycosyltransferase